MSARYTAVTSMPEAAPRDLDRELERHRNVEPWRDKLELRLDNRQVFFLFFGSAVVACMLFILGVMVGKRIETRGQAEAATPQDPLGALDRAHDPPPGGSTAAAEPELSFPNTLIGGAGAANKPKTSVAKPKALAAPKPVAAASAAAPKPGVAAPVAAKPPVSVLAAPKPVVAASAAAPKPGVAAPVAPKAAASPAVPPKLATPPAPVKGKFTLHLSTFSTAEEATEFAQRFPGAFVVSPPPGTGTGGAFRVRYGNFGSFKEAAAAKDSFEKQHNMIALVAAR